MMVERKTVVSPCVQVINRVWSRVMRYLISLSGRRELAWTPDSRQVRHSTKYIKSNKVTIKDPVKLLLEKLSKLSPFVVNQRGLQPAHLPSGVLTVTCRGSSRKCTFNPTNSPSTYPRRDKQCRSSAIPAATANRLVWVSHS